MTANQHRKFMELFSLNSEPLIKEMSRLDIMIPKTYSVQDDGSLKQSSRDSWPEWARNYWESLENAVETIRDMAMKEALK